MINIDKYRAKFEERCLAAGLTKLDKPVDTEELVYTAFEIEDDRNFDSLFFEPAVKALIRNMAEDENREFYRVDVDQKDNVIVFTSSRGDNSVKQVFLQLAKWGHDPNIPP